MTIAAIPSVPALSFLDRLAPLLGQPPVQPVPAVSFPDPIASGIEGVNASVLRAEGMIRAFALDDSIPVHQVTFALEQARLQLELAVQIRERLIETYQQLMNMQL
jgi:flagellar hook-basal body complex protein FliE